MSRLGSLVVFEGADEVGKTSIVEGVAAYLRSTGEDVQTLAFPGRDSGTLGAHIYALHHRPADFGIYVQPSAASSQLLHIAAHLDAIERVITPAVAAGKTVLLDRFWWSTWAYGLVSGADRALLREMIALEKLCWGTLVPNIVILISRSMPLSQVKDIALWKCIAREYDALAASESAHHTVTRVDNHSDLATALRAVLRAMRKLDPPVRNARKPNRRLPEVSVSEVQVRTIAGASNKSEPSCEENLFDSPPTLIKQPPFSIHTALAPTVATAVYDTYWHFAAKRQEVFFRKQRSPHPPWTDDPILLTHKFTNAYRASDRVSQYLIRNVIYAGEQSEEEIFFRILVFKTFNRIGTWELLTQEFGMVRWADYAFIDYDRVLTEALAAGERIYSAAYIMSSGRSAFGSEKKHRNHLQLIETMMRARVPAKVSEASSMQEVFELLMTFPSIGSFLAYQYAIDLNYSSLTRFSEMEFVVPGPGARDGLRKCFANFGGLNEADLIRRVADLQEREFERLGLCFETLWGRRLQLIDCQNLFCEVDKYARVAHPEVAGLTGRTRIKQKYRPNWDPICYWYPPKWGLNERIAEGVPNVPYI